MSGIKILPKKTTKKSSKNTTVVAKIEPVVQNVNAFRVGGLTEVDNQRYLNYATFEKELLKEKTLASAMKRVYKCVDYYNSQDADASNNCVFTFKQLGRLLTVLRKHFKK